MLRILPCYAVRWKKRIKRARPRQRKAAWQLIKAPLGRTSVLAAALMISLGANWGPPEKAASEETTKQILRGQILFSRVWQANDETATGDGLGPLFNAKSCSECHSQGGIGGSGKGEHNVDLLSIIPPRNIGTVDRKKFAEEVKKLHPGLVADGSVRPSITLHKFGTNPGYETWQGLLRMFIDSQSDKRGPDQMALEITQRRTPALFGAGLIDSIPDSVLQEVAAEQAKRNAAPKGRVALASDGHVGKFGWRGQTSTLSEFVMGACANELGLQVVGKDQAIDPLNTAHQTHQRDLSKQQCDDLVAFVASLAPPRQRPAASGPSEDRRALGAQLFHKVGCAECHRPNVGQVAGIYSDLLLHDMGPDLADPIGANPPESSASSSRSASYSGGPPNVFVSVPPETKREWRTPPLWGVANSGPYLHDGRATTLHTAICQHGGEATASRLDYAKLSNDGRDKLLTFLESLGQPTAE